VNVRIVSVCLVTLFFTVPAMAEGIHIKPGKWKMTSTMTMSMLPQPKTTVSTECIKDDELGPEDFNEDGDSPCSFSDFVVDGNTASWVISCPFEGGKKMGGKWHFTSQGDSISGDGAMSADMEGMKIEMTMGWQGLRIGDCDQE